MIPSIADVVRQFKREWTECLAPEAISQLCREAGLSWRERLLTPAVTVQLMLLQVLHGNTAVSHLPHLAKMRFCSSSFVRARMRLPLSIFKLLLQRISDCLQEEDYNKQTWLGHRVFVADGTAVSMPDTPELEEHFGYACKQRKGATFPVARLVFMLHLGTGMVAKLIINPFRSHEARQVDQLHPELREGDIFLGDRAFCSFYHFCLLLQRKTHAVMRMGARLVADFTPGRPGVRSGEIPSRVGQPRSTQLRIIGKKDHVVEWYKPAKAKWMTKEQHQELPNAVVVREIQYRVSQKGFRTRTITVITTLLDEKKYPAKKIAELYRMRWEIETNFNHLKTTMKMDILKTKTPDTVIKQLIAFCILYNLVRLVMIQAARKQRVPINRISFVDALRWLAAAYPNDRIHYIQIIPERPNRFEPRSRKRRPKPGYPYLMMPRQELRKKKLSQCVAA